MKKHIFLKKNSEVLVKPWNKQCWLSEILWEKKSLMLLNDFLNFQTIVTVVTVKLHIFIAIELKKKHQTIQLIK